jgi:hypothetical protein
LQPSLHQQSNPELHLPRAEDAEPTGAVEISGVRVTYDVQRRRARQARCGTAILDQGPANALAPRVGLDEEGIQFRISIFSRKDRRKAPDRPICLGDEYSSGLDLMKRQFDGAGIRQQCLSISGVVERSAPQKRLERTLLRRASNSNVDAMHAVQTKPNQDFPIIGIDQNRYTADARIEVRSPKPASRRT